MALAATGRNTAAAAMLAGMEDYPRGSQNQADLVREVGLPVARAVLANGQGRHAEAVALMRPVLGEMRQLGGSHAQQDVLEQMFLSAALRAGRMDDVKLLIERVRSRHPVAPEQRIGYAEAARRLNS